jgi:hypothetical protein
MPTEVCDERPGVRDENGEHSDDDDSHHTFS